MRLATSNHELLLRALVQTGQLYQGFSLSDATLPFAPRIARAQAYPTRPVLIIVGFPERSAGP